MANSVYLKRTMTKILGYTWIKDSELRELQRDAEKYRCVTPVEKPLEENISLDFTVDQKKHLVGQLSPIRTGLGTVQSSIAKILQILEELHKEKASDSNIAEFKPAFDSEPKAKANIHSSATYWALADLLQNMYTNEQNRLRECEDEEVRSMSKIEYLRHVESKVRTAFISWSGSNL